MIGSCDKKKTMYSRPHGKLSSWILLLSWQSGKAKKLATGPPTSPLLKKFTFKLLILKPLFVRSSPDKQRLKNVWQSGCTFIPDTVSKKKWRRNYSKNLIVSYSADIYLEFRIYTYTHILPYYHILVYCQATPCRSKSPRLARRILLTFALSGIFGLKAAWPPCCSQKKAARKMAVLINHSLQLLHHLGSYITLPKKIFDYIWPWRILLFLLEAFWATTKFIKTHPGEENQGGTMRQGAIRRLSFRVLCSWQGADLGATDHHFGSGTLPKRTVNWNCMTSYAPNNVSLSHDAGSPVLAANDENTIFVEAIRLA